MTQHAASPGDAPHHVVHVELPPATRQLLRRALQAYRVGGPTLQGLAAVAQRAADDAHQHGWHAEQTIPALKHAWSEMGPELVDVSSSDARALLEALVSAYIRAHFAPAASLPPREAPLRQPDA